MGKRKRGDLGRESTAEMKKKEESTRVLPTHSKNTSREASTMIQIVVGTYEKVVHGVIATISYETEDNFKTQAHVEFTDSFLLKPHNAAIRCLALSPPKSQKIVLASGSTDQEIQLYQLSTRSPVPSGPIDSGLLTTVDENMSPDAGNRSLGALEQHAGAINALLFPSRSKLLSAADDCTIAVTRTVDWTSLSTIKTPIPKAQGRPSGDTAPLGGTPAGVSDFAVHPSMKLMLSVGKGEKCLRLWNLVTGKKAGVLNFEKNVLQGVGEGKWASGDGRKVRWNGVGEEFVVGFEKGCVVYGIDSRPKCRILPVPTTKVHQLRYIPVPRGGDADFEYLALSTEDGRIIFYRTDIPAVPIDEEDKDDGLRCLQPVAQFGGSPDRLTGRIKDFQALRLPGASEVTFIACGSDGTIRLWLVEDTELTGDSAIGSFTDADKLNGVEGSQSSTEPVGQLIGLYQSKNRITCVAAFLMSEGREFVPSDVQNGGRPENRGGEGESMKP